MTSLQDICHLITDGKHGDCQNKENSGFYFVSCKDVKDGWVDYSGAREITEADFFDTHKRTQLEPNDILITNSGTIGRMALVPNTSKTDHTTFQKSVAIVKPDKEKVIPEWLYYSLRGNRDALIASAGGTAQKNLLLRDLRAFSITVPPLPTQKKIAAILSAYDDLIENNTRRIKILEEMAQALYREWFVEFRFPGHENVEVVDDGCGRMIPEGWTIKKVEDVCSKLASGGTPARKNLQYWENGTIDWYKTKELQDNFLFFSEEKISDDGLKNSSAKKFPENSIIIALYAAPTLGRMGILTKASTFNQAACGLIPDSKQCNMPFLYLSLLNSREYFYSIAMGAAQQNINVQKLRDTPIVLPTNEIIDEFGKNMIPIFLKIKNTAEKNLILTKTRDLLLPRLIEGEVDVADLDIAISENNGE